jgi:predicted CopG family antitoxin
LDLDAYERLKAAKRPNDSFSDVVRRVTFHEKSLTAGDLIARLKERGPFFSESDLEDLDHTHEQLSQPPDIF